MPLARRAPHSRVRPVSRFERRRRELGLTQADVAERARLSPSQVSRIENGLVPSLDAQRRLANVLAASVDELWPLAALFAAEIEDGA